MEAKRNQLLSLLDEATRLAHELRQDPTADPAFQQKVTQKSKLLTRTLQTPMDQVWELFFQPHTLSITTTALDAGWLQALVSAGETGISSDQLATISGADRSLVRRMMRVLAAVQGSQWAVQPISPPGPPGTVLPSREARDRI
ncbi:hypothetical protein EJ04DRAFT_563300 [Polyplosphaeria fusca]|uniref:DNA-binding protein n=1 Tax=Polyplosphaeria fusca TaxID=682080 RepID=A0A9P4V2H4_9PLEO|nr:hypothetical protein EJ04DRAFT_563300 [Polyplosphaeria fusca]